MMIKFSSILSLSIRVLAIFGFATTAVMSLSAEEPGQTVVQSEELQQIDNRLKALYNDLKEFRKLASKDELNAQRYLRVDSEEYIENVQLDETDEANIKAIKEQIIQLQARKKILLKQATGK